MLGLASIVIDDKKEDGYAVAKTLWNKGYPCLFFEYSAERLALPIKKQKSVRVIFQDIKLTSGGTPTTNDYDQAALSITKLLEEDNGPWLLATWSTWEGEHGEKLFTHLRENLSECIRPFNFVCLDKEALCVGGKSSHTEVKDDLNQTEIDTLFSKCEEELNKFSSFMAISEWEGNVFGAAQRVANDLLSVPLGLNPSNFDDSLGNMLEKIGTEECGKESPLEEKSKGVTRVLNGLVANKSNLMQVINQTGLKNVLPQPDIPLEKKREWARRINNLLHLEYDQSAKNYPGSIYKFKKPKHYYSENGELIENLKDYFSEETLKRYILDELKQEPSFETIIINSQLVLIDLTPPCDHVNGKAFWKKFIVGVEVIVSPDDLNSKTRIKKFFDKLKHMSRWKSPCFSIKNQDQDSDIRFFYVDLRLIMSVPDNSHFTSELDFRYLLKEQLQRELVSYVSSHLSRPGILDIAR